MRLTKGALVVLSVLVAALAVSNFLLWREVSREAMQRPTAPTPQAVSPRAEPGAALQLEDEAPELAPYMGQLQRLMHKLQLSVAADHAELASFYLYETKELTHAICEDVPEYRGYPIALLIGRTLSPKLDAVERALEGKDPEALERAYEGAIAACNDCHRATKHAFIRIPTSAKGLPYLQAFERAEAP